MVICLCASYLTRNARSLVTSKMLEIAGRWLKPTWRFNSIRILSRLYRRQQNSYLLCREHFFVLPRHHPVHVKLENLSLTLFFFFFGFRQSCLLSSRYSRKYSTTRISLKLVMLLPARIRTRRASKTKKTGAPNNHKTTLAPSSSEAKT